MRTVTVDLPWSKPPITGNRTRGHPHARAKEVETAKAQARAAILAAAPTMLPGVNITLHYRPMNRQRRDADNLFPTLKVVQDALVLEGVIYEDSWVTVPSATCRIHPPNGEPAAMWVVLEEIE
jgi:crossover junction endodeoxyribonuclease RusA